MSPLNNNNNYANCDIRQSVEFVSSHETFVQQAYSCINESNFAEAIQHLINALSKSPENETLYELLFKLLPKADDIELSNIVGNLSPLLERTSDLFDRQLQLAATFARWNVEAAEKNKNEIEKIRLYSEAMDYYSAAIRIAKRIGDGDLIHSYHQIMSHLLLKTFTLNFEEKLYDNKGKPGKFFQLVESISYFTPYCCSHEDIAIIKKLYVSAGGITAHINPASKKEYLSAMEIIEKGIHGLKLSPQAMTEKYREQIKTLRVCFKKLVNCSFDDVKKYQLELTDKLRGFIKQMLDDLFIMLGEAPCGYDLRAMGSIGREEMCPFSDLEFMLLIEKEEHRPYFQKFIRLFNLQVVSLGETNYATHPIFTCLRKTLPSGFYFDPGNPLQDIRLLGSSDSVAKLQEIAPLSAGPNTIENTLLKSVSLSTNFPQLFLDYQKKINDILDLGSIREERFLNLVNRRYKEFHGCKNLTIPAQWPFPILPSIVHLKDHYVQFLHFLLADMALLWGIEETNTLAVIDRLVEKEVFTELSGSLIKRAIYQIYQMRIRLHLYYKEQKELGYQEGLSGCVLINEEKNNLEKIYWLVLRPLYHNCLLLVIEKKFPVKTVFSQIDLISLCMDEIFKSKEKVNIFLPLIKHLAQDPLANHIENFKRLSTRSNLENLRQEYLKVLINSNIPLPLIDQICTIPNRSGLRLAFQRDEDELRSKILAITTAQPLSARASQVKIVSAHGVRYLNPEFVENILDEEGDIKNNYTGSAHRVASAGGLHFKQKPTHPLMEFAIHNLYYRLAGRLTPSTELVRFEVNGKKMYPVLISKTIEGQTLKEIVKDTFVLSDSQWTKWCWFLLASILTRPGDGRPSNFILAEHLYCIDNDISFVEPFVKGIFSKVNFCTVLFCLFKTRPIDRFVLDEFCLLHADIILWDWIEEVIFKENEYLSLFEENERDTLYHYKFVPLNPHAPKPKKDPDNRFKANILFNEGTLATLNTQFVHLQNKIRELLTVEKMPTPLDLLKMIITLKGDQPFLIQAPGQSIYNYYSNPSGNTVENQLKWITSRDHNLSFSSLQSDVACLGRSPSHEQIERKKTFSAEKAKEELFQSFIERNPSYLTIGVIKDKETVMANFNKIKEGEKPDNERQMFALKSIISLLPEKLVSVSLQHCSVLNTKMLIYFLHPEIEYLDLMFCPLLIKSDIELIQKKCCKLKFLNLSGCSGITSLQEGIFGNPLQFPILKELHIDKCRSLKSIKLVSFCLEEFHARMNPSLSEVNIESGFKFNCFLQDCQNLLPTRVIITSDFQRGRVKEMILESPYLKNDKCSILRLLKESPAFFHCASIELKNDRDFVIKVVAEYGICLEYASEGFKNDQDIVMAAVTNNAYAINYASRELQNNREFILRIINKNEKTLPYICKELQRDREYIAAAVSAHEHALKYASHELQDDPEIVMLAATKNGSALQYASKDLQNNREFILKVIGKNGKVLQYASKELQNDREIVMAAITNEGSALEYASEELQGNDEFIMQAISLNGKVLKYTNRRNSKKFVFFAVKKNGCALEYASAEIQNDDTIVKAAIEQNGEAFQYASKELRNDRKFILEAIKKSYCVFRYVSKELQNDREFVISAVTNNESALQYFSEELKQEREFILRIINKNEKTLPYICKELQRDREYIAAAVSAHEDALKYASHELQDDPEIVIRAADKNGSALQYASKDLQNNREFILKVIGKNGKALKYVRKQLQNNREIVMAAITNEESALEYASEELQNDREFVLEALKKNGAIFKHVIKKFKNDQQLALVAFNSKFYCRLGFLKYVGNELKNDREFVIKIISKQGFDLQYAIEEFKNDREIIKAALSNFDYVLEYGGKSVKNDRDIVEASVLKNGYTLKYASIELQNDREIVITAVTNNESALQYASEELKSNREFLLEVLAKKGGALKYIKNNFQNNRDIVITAVTNNESALQYASEELKSNREFLLEVLAKKGGALKYINKDFQNDRVLVMAAVNNNREALQYASKELQNDHEFVRSLINYNKSSLEFVCEELRNDPEIVLTAVTHNGLALEFAGKELRNDRQIVLTAVSNTYAALKFASEELKNDKKFILSIATKEGNLPIYKRWYHFFEYIGTELRNDRDFVLRAVSDDGGVLSFVGNMLKKDKEIVTAAIFCYRPLGGIDAFEYADEVLKNDKDYILELVKKDGSLMRFASSEVQNDRDVVMAAVCKKGLHYANSTFKNDKKVVLVAVTHDPWALKEASLALQNDREVVLVAVSNDGRTLQYAIEELRADKQIVLAAVTQNGMALEHAAEVLRHDREIVLTAVTQIGKALEHADHELKGDIEIVLAAITPSKRYFQLLREEHQNDQEKIRKSTQDLYKWYAEFFLFADVELQKSKKFLMEAVTYNGYIIQYISEEYRNSREIFLAAVCHFGLSLQYSSEELRNDKSIVLAAVTQEGTALEFASEELKDDREISLAAITQDIEAYRYVSNHLRENKEFGQLLMQSIL